MATTTRIGDSMKSRPKPLAEQVIVVTGSSSGIGRLTAEAAVARGAAVVLVSRDGAALRTLQESLAALSGRTLVVEADVGDAEAVDRVVSAAVAHFGRIDTWVNNAGVAAYSPLADLPLDEHRRIFDTNYFGVVHGSLAAVRHFRTRSGPGTIINIGSLNSDVAIPLLSAYSASKHAVKGFTDALRRELLTSDPNVSVTLVKPAGIATALPQHARNHLDHEPRVAPPLYAPEIVVDAILRAAVRPRREVVIGAVGPLLRGPLVLFPNLMDRLLARVVPPLSTSSHPLTGTDNLTSPTRGGETHYRYAPGLPISAYTALQTRPRLTALAVALIGVAFLTRRRR